jgi:hypothetical protein
MWIPIKTLLRALADFRFAAVGGLRKARRGGSSAAGARGGLVLSEPV